MRNPTGTRDLSGQQLLYRNKIFDTFKQIAETYGAVSLDTPVMELYDTVTNVYGEEFNKLVFRLKDSTDELILRYDLTVPFARYVGMNGLRQFRRYQIGKVYRADDPQISKGRFREFYQCDFDIAGSSESMIYDTEIIDFAHNVLTELLGCEFTIRINHREVIYDCLKGLKVSDDNIKTVSSSLDKLDKKTIDEICDELRQKGIDDDTVERIRDFINKKNYDELISDETKKSVLTLLSLAKKYKNVIFDPLLVRGLDYYTGVIFEAYYTKKDVMESAICAEKV